MAAGLRFVLISGLLVMVATADAAAAIPLNSLPPHVTGSAAVGATLTTTTGTWSGADGLYSYQWWDCMPDGHGGCIPTAVGTNSTYVVRASDVGGTMYVAVKAHNSSGWSLAAVSDNSIGPIAPAGTPTNTALPQISGDAVVGATLTSTPGAWSGAVSGYQYQWWECDP